MVHFSSWREIVRAILSLCQVLQKLHEARVLLNDFSAVQWNEDEGRVFIYELAHSMDVPVPVEQSDEADDSQAVWADADFAGPEVQRNWLAEVGVTSDLYGLSAINCCLANLTILPPRSIVHPQTQTIKPCHFHPRYTTPY